MSNRRLTRLSAACLLGLPLAGCIVVPQQPYDSQQPDYSGQPVYQSAQPVPYEPEQDVEYVVAEPPPPLPVYEQPLCPGPGFIWTPGYWNYSQNGGYYWVPGTWALPPQPNLYWTPAYWALGDSGFHFHQGYWGVHVGYYGGVRYGYGYEGSGYEGGRWRNNEFVYNTAVNRVDISVVRNTYNSPVFYSGPGNRNGYGDRDDRHARFSADEEAAERDRHFRPTREQAQHQDAASSERGLYASANRGRPPIAATPRPGVSFGAVGASPGRGPDRRWDDDDRDRDRGASRRDDQPAQGWRPDRDRQRDDGRSMNPSRDEQDGRARQQTQQQQEQQRQQQEQQRQSQQQMQQQRQQEMQQQVLQQRQQQQLQQRQQDPPPPQGSNRQWVQQRLQQQQQREQQQREQPAAAPQRQGPPPNAAPAPSPGEPPRNRRDQPDRGERGDGR